MKFQNYLPFDPTNEAALRESIERLAALTGSPVTIETKLVVNTESVELSLMLDQLRDALKKGGALPRAKVRAKKGKRMGRPPGSGKKSKTAKKKPRGKLARTWKVIESGEMINRSELDRRLTEHTIPAGTKLHHPKHGDVTVGKGETTAFAYVLVNQHGDQL